jgi:HAE1 family hydrophobic/amphiphilic exporter-1
MAPQKRSEKLNGMPLSDTSIRQPVFITMLMLLTVTFGLLAFRTMPVNLLPDFEVPVIVVTVAYPGAGPESVAEQVARPIEDAVNTINSLENITSSSNEGIAQIILEFAEGTDVERADRDVREKVDGILPSLPRDIRDPIFQRFDPNSAPIMSISISDDGTRTPLELRRLVDDEIVPRLQRAQGVGSATVSGGEERQINVLMQLDKLSAYQILPVQITRSLQQANANLGLGTITSGSQDISLRAPSLLNSPEDIANIQITGTPYRIGDVAVIEDGVAERSTYSRLDGQDTIIVNIRKQSGTNTVQVVDNVKVELAQLFENRTDLRYVIPNDQSEAVRQSTISSIEELIFAAVAALLVVMGFFGGVRKLFTTALVPALIAVGGIYVLPAFGVPINPVLPLGLSIGLLIVLTFFRDRNTLVTMAGLPIIIIGTFAFMPIFGLTINLITLLALSLCVGLVIDDAIVVRENIFRHTERGESPRVAASKGTAEVALSVLAMTFTIVAVFVPVTFTTGTTGIIFKSFGITIAIAILLSLVEAFMFAPMLSANLFRRKKVEAAPHDAAHSHVGAIAQSHGPEYADLSDAEKSLLHEAQEDPGALGRAYERLLTQSLRNIWTRLAVVAIAIGVLVASIGVAAGLRFSFFPQQDPGEFLVGFELSPGTTLDETDSVARSVEQVLLADPAVASVNSTVGFSGNPERVEYFVKLHEGEESPPAQARMRAQLTDIPNLVFALPIAGGPSSTQVSGRQMQLSIQSTQPATEIDAYINQVQNELFPSVAGAVDIASNYRSGKPEIRFLADPARIGDLGLTNDDIASSVRALINGERATVLRQSGQDIDIFVRLQESDRASPNSLRDIIIPTRAGPVPLSSLGTVEVSSGPTTIRRYNRLNQVLIGANLQDRNIGEAQAELQTKLDAIAKPDGVTTSFVGLVQQQTEGFAGLFLAMALSVLFVYMVLASQFGSFTQPLVIMMAMPFSFIGAFIALRITNTDLDITGMIGLIMLLGLVVKNSILLVDFTNRLRRAGMEKHPAIALAGAIRLRPILMTTFSLIAGALPVAMGIHIVGTGEGGEFRKGLATVLIGGLTTSMFLTLLVVPTAYSLVESLTERLSRRFRQRDDEDAGLPSETAPPAPAPVGEPVGAPAAATTATTTATATTGDGRGQQTATQTS